MLPMVPTATANPTRAHAAGESTSLNWRSRESMKLRSNQGPFGRGCRLPGTAQADFPRKMKGRNPSTLQRCVMRSTCETKEPHRRSSENLDAATALPMSLIGTKVTSRDVRTKSALEAEMEIATRHLDVLQ